METTGESRIGQPFARKDGPDKTHGRTLFADDERRPGLLHARLVLSPHAYAEIRSIDVTAALAAGGVRGVYTGADWEVRIGLYLGDKPPLARGMVRHHGEPVGRGMGGMDY